MRRRTSLLQYVRLRKSGAHLLRREPVPRGRATPSPVAAAGARQAESLWVAMTSTSAARQVLDRHHRRYCVDFAGSDRSPCRASHRMMSMGCAVTGEPSTSLANVMMPRTRSPISSRSDPRVPCCQSIHPTINGCGSRMSTLLRIPGTGQDAISPAGMASGTCSQTEVNGGGQLVAVTPTRFSRWAPKVRREKDKGPPTRCERCHRKTPTMRNGPFVMPWR